MIFTNVLLVKESKADEREKERPHHRAVAAARAAASDFL